MGKLSGKVAVITGGTTGIGLATARLFAAEGAKVIVTGRNAETLAAARKELARVAEVVQSDAGDSVQVRKLFEDIGRSLQPFPRDFVVLLIRFIGTDLEQ